jgi:hypothetical protein
MDGIPVKKLARELKVPVAELIQQLQESGTNVTAENDLVSGEQQLRLLKQNRSRDQKSDAKENVSLADLKAAKNLVALNELLTRAMANRTIQALIKDEDLQTVSDTIVERAAKERKPLLAAAILGRLAAVARAEARTSSIYERADEVLTEEPASLSTLPDTDGKQKQYAAQMLAHATTPWVVDYRYREALAIDTADNARRELLATNLTQEGSISAWIAAITGHASELSGIANPEARFKRIRRIFSVMHDVTTVWRGDVGLDVGLRLADCLKAFLTGKLADIEQETIFDAVDNLLAILVRVIELRFSTALSAETYAMIEQGKKTLGPGLWGRLIEAAENMPGVRIALLETALVLARQNRADDKIMVALKASYTSRQQTAAAVKRHFQDAKDLDPHYANWWRSVGDVSEARRHVEQKVGNNEDEQIGALLIEVESNREAMEKVGGTVVDYLGISEPVLASTVKKAASGYQMIAQTAKRLARMRKLTKTDLKGQRVEYNPLEHEMLGGHKPGIRRVKVVRDGIQKEFGGQKRTLVKPWVEPESD